MIYVKVQLNNLHQHEMYEITDDLGNQKEVNTFNIYGEWLNRGYNQIELNDALDLMNEKDELFSVFDDKGMLIETRVTL